MKEELRSILNSVLQIGFYFLSGLIFMDIWNWFPHEVLGAPSIGYAGSLGILLLINFFKNKDVHLIINESDESTPDDNLVLTRTVYLFLWILITWGIGFIVHLFI